MGKIREFNFTTSVETSSPPTAGEPSDPTDLVTKEYADDHYVQGGEPVADVAALKAVAAADRADGDALFVTSLRAFFVFNAASSATGDDLTVITPTAGTGRWLIARPLNYDDHLNLQNQKELRLSELTANGTHYTGWKAPASLAATIGPYTLPTSETVGGFLQLSSSGVTTWGSPAGATEYIPDYRWASVSQLELGAASINIGGTIYTNVGATTFDFANGTGDNGLDTGSEANNTWYYLYAVPSTGSNFMLKASTTRPLELGGAGPSVSGAPFRYLGVFRNGDANSINADIIRFNKTGAKFQFCERKNINGIHAGLILDNQPNDITWTFSIGTGTTQLPFESMWTFLGSANDGAANARMRISARSGAGVVVYGSGYVVGDGSGSQVPHVVAELPVYANPASLVDIFLDSLNNVVNITLSAHGWIDPVLAARGNL